jgi:catechol 2,3-dioxygenase-like lactoylglutathione lyase family enzyme
MIKAIKFVSIPVVDQERALSFYTGKLGFQVLTDQPHTDPPQNDKRRWIELGLPGAETGIVLFGGGTNITFMSNNVTKTYEELRQRGVEFTREPVTSHWGASATFRDSEGNTFVLSSR